MSKGPGKVQRAISALIAANPEGAWSFAELCRLIYRPGFPTRARKSAVGRAIKRMALPGTWRVGSHDGDRRWWLYDECSLASMRTMCWGWHKSHFEPGGFVFKGVERAKRFRDASPVERIDMRIEDERGEIGRLKMMDALTPAAVNEIAERVAALEAEKAALLAGPLAPE
jgi:hypothetical protein